MPSTDITNTWMHPFRSSLTFTHCPFLPLFEKNGLAFIKLLQRTVWNQQSVYITIYNNFCTFDNSSDHFLLYFVISNFKKSPFSILWSTTPTFMCWHCTSLIVLKSLVSLFLVPDLFYWLPMQLLIISGYFVFSSEIL